MKNRHLLFFLLFVAALASPVFWGGVGFLPKRERPWHLQDWVYEDSLPPIYQQKYTITGPARIMEQVEKTQQRRAIFLIDGWAVPVDEAELETQLSFFDSIPHKAYIHYRYSNRSVHAEMVEYRHKSSNSLYVYGGDSLEYQRQEYIPGLGFQEMFFCQMCGDSAMLAKIDSIAGTNVFDFTAWTAEDYRYGDGDRLNRLFELLAYFAKNHLEMQIVIVGAHRPILGKPEMRRKYYAHWVPVVVLN